MGRLQSLRKDTKLNVDNFLKREISDIDFIIKVYLSDEL